MSDLIDRKAAIDVIDKIFPADPMHNEYTEGITCGAALAKDFIKQLPPAEPKKGQWIFTRYYVWECSECGKNPTIGMGYIQRRSELFRYCPNCGAEMEVTE